MKALLDILWRVAVSPVTFVVLALLWCLDLAVGSLVAASRPDLFASMDGYPFAIWLELVGRRALPHSAWVYLLVALTWAMVLSLLLCTLNWFFRRRKRMLGVGEVLVHLGFLLVFAGFVLGSTLGTRVQGVVVAQGTTAPVGDTGLSLRLDRIEAVRGPRGVVDTPAAVALLAEGKEVAAAVARVNHPLMWGPTVVYARDMREQLVGVEVELAGVGKVQVTPDAPAPLPDGNRLVLGLLLQEGETMSGLTGPGGVVSLATPGGRALGSAYLSPRGRMTARLGGTDARLSGGVVHTAGVFDVHRDPGVWLVIVGGLILALGTVWAFAGYLATPKVE